MTIFGPDNAIAYAQFRLRGGWRNLGTTGAVYALALGGTMIASVRVIDAPSARVLDGWVPLLLGIQAFLLLAFGGTRVAAAVRFDLNSRIIESHRLMPVGGGEAVAGYVLGAASQALVLAGVTLVLGAVACTAGSIAFTSWLAANALLAAFAAFVWVVLAYLAFLLRTPIAWATVLLVVVCLSQGSLFAAVPALAVLTTPVIGPSVFALRGLGEPLAVPYAAAMLCQIGVAAACFAAARRLYNRDDAVGLGPLLGLLLLAGLAGASWAGIAGWDEFAPRWLRLRRSEVPGPPVRLVCSLLLLLLAAVVPVSASARLAKEWSERRARDPALAGRRPVPGSVVAVLAGAVLAALPPALVVASRTLPSVQRYAPAEPGPQEWADIGRPWAATGLVAAFSLLAYGIVLRVAHRVGRPTKAVGVAWFVLAWVGPVIADAVRHARAIGTPGYNPGDGPFGAMAACSPVGAIITLWTGIADDHAQVGVASQAVLVALASVALFAATSGRRTNETPPFEPAAV